MSSNSAGAVRGKQLPLASLTDLRCTACTLSVPSNLDSVQSRTAGMSRRPRPVRSCRWRIRSSCSSQTRRSGLHAKQTEQADNRE